MTICPVSGKAVVTEQTARRDVARIRAKARAKGFRERVNAYRCNGCGGWHVGHAPRHRRRRMVLA